MKISVKCISYTGQIHTYTQVWYPEYIKNSQSSIIRKHTTQLTNGQKTKDPNRQFRNTHGKLAHKTCPVSLVIREMHIKISVRYHHTLIRMAQKTDNIKC